MNSWLFEVDLEVRAWAAVALCLATVAVAVARLAARVAYQALLVARESLVRRLAPPEQEEPMEDLEVVPVVTETHQGLQALLALAQEDRLGWAARVERQAALEAWAWGPRVASEESRAALAELVRLAQADPTLARRAQAARAAQAVW